MTTTSQVGIALVGVGKYASEELIPAFAHTNYCRLAGLVTGSSEKAAQLQSKYNLEAENIYLYDSFDDIANNPNIDIVYVVLPNALHHEFVIRAARAGKHVICEKPMALSTRECDEMIHACELNNVQLSIGYRLHFEPYNQRMMELGRKKELGNIKKIIAENGLGHVEGWRLDYQLAGGGPLMDVGIYCIQAVRYTTGSEPISVTAKEHPKTDLSTFDEVEEGLSWSMEMPNGIVAECKCSYSQSMDCLRAETSDAWFELRPAYAYRGLAGATSAGKINLPAINQQAAQMDAFALAVRENRKSSVPGEMGRQDVKIIQAIYESARTGKTVRID
ncbi:MAG TPA: Gfo/Idh/MocA family oxidoreductase [Ohtaekwangia sp.]|nr:Gfo/Idh/MocA family oxidoreductase [Ohtaekwangia sp.]